MPAKSHGSVDVIALIVAAGRGERLGGDLPKQYLRVGGRPILAVTADRFLNHPLVDGVRVVISANDDTLYEEAMPSHAHLLPPVVGGLTRQESVRKGLESLVPLAPSMVLIHDAARPFCSDGVITELIERLNDVKGVYAGIPVVDTLRQHKAHPSASDLIDRENVWRAQTPQAFRFEDILEAHRDAVGEVFTDDVAVAQNAGLEVEVVRGTRENFKITTENDLEMAETLLRNASPLPQSTEVRTGMGYDVHRFCDGEKVWLCGVEINHTRSLKGHSDADVALHALTDAILGAVGQGDIGDHFPPSDEKWKGAPSRLFLEHAASLVREQNATISNVDLTIICEEPKIAPHRQRMRESVAEILRLPQARISVKATTTEGLGFTGRREGIAAQAVATINVPRGE